MLYQLRSKIRNSSSRPSAVLGARKHIRPARSRSQEFLEYTLFSPNDDQSGTWRTPLRLWLGLAGIHRVPKASIGMTALAILVTYFAYSTAHELVQMLNYPLLREFSYMGLKLVLTLLFVVLVLSQTITAYSRVYGARDTTFLLYTPVSSSIWYLARFVDSSIRSSWLFYLLALPALIGFAEAFSMPFSSVILSIGLLTVFAGIAAATGGILATCWAAFVPPGPLFPTLILFLCPIAVMVFLGSSLGVLPFVERPSQAASLLSALPLLLEPCPVWLPPYWISESLIELSLGRPLTFQWPMISCAAFIGITALAFLLHDIFQVSGFANVLELDGKRKSESSSRPVRLPKVFRDRGGVRPIWYALMVKELRLILRDTTQSMQFVILLAMTLFYTYQLRGLRALVPRDSAIGTALLATTNLYLGLVVTSAIVARFVYPSVSLEGRSYTLLRQAPLSIGGFLRHKLALWSIILGIVSITILVSGGWAVHIPLPLLWATALLAPLISIGVVGIGIGLGARYAKFDWDYTSQLSNGIGGLVYFCLTLLYLSFTFIPALAIFFFLEMKTSETLGSQSLCLAACGLLITATTVLGVRQSLRVGARRLESLEGYRT